MQQLQLYTTRSRRRKDPITPRAPVNSPEFWFAMQWAMLAGFATSYPVNWLLVRSGIKERM